MIGHSEVIEALRKRFEPDPRVLAFWIEGSIAGGTADVLADLDVVLDVADGNEDAVLAEIEEAVATLGELDIVSELERPNAFLWYKVFHIEGTSEHLLIDTTVQRHSRDFTFWEGAEHRPHVIFDKAGVVRSGVLDTATQEACKAQRLRALRSRYAQRSRVRKYIERGKFLESWAYYQNFVLRPLVELLRLRYAPLQADHGLVHISEVLPPEVRTRLEKLYQVGSLADIGAKCDDADALFEEMLGDFAVSSRMARRIAVCISKIHTRVYTALGWTAARWFGMRRIPATSSRTIQNAGSRAVRSSRH